LREGRNAPAQGLFWPYGVRSEEFKNGLITIVIPEFIPYDQSARLLHNQATNFLQRKLRSQ
jgi:hypothetical protein